MSSSNNPTKFSEAVESPSEEHITVTGKDESPPSNTHGPVHLVGADPSTQPPLATTADELETRKGGRFAYLKTKQFWIVLLLSQILAISQTGTNTFTTLLQQYESFNIPAFQNIFTYILLTLIYTTTTLYKYGLKKWCALICQDGWRYFILAFCDVQGNYFTVKGYQYTNIMSAQLIGFWAIVVVVIVSLVFLKVRYNLLQYVGIVICCAGLGILIASDHISGRSASEASDAVKGDLFVLVGATAYGLSNVIEEFLVSKRPVYEVLGQLSFWGFWINGVQGAIFDREQLKNTVWTPKIGGYLTGFTLILTWFYSGAPIVFRMASAAFFNIGLLTGNFWGVAIGTSVFGNPVHWMYPIAFVLIIIGHFVYYGTEGVLGEARKPWLGENQEGGDDGLGTARRHLERPNTIV